MKRWYYPVLALAICLGLVGTLVAQASPAYASYSYGLTPGYWKNHPDAWSGTGYLPGQYYDEVFGVGPHITLLAAAGMGGGRANALARQAVAGLLNAGTFGIDYGYTQAEVIERVQWAYTYGTFEYWKNEFEYYNQKGAPGD